MNVETLLNRLQERGVRLHAEADELVVRAPRGAIDAELAAQLREHKAAVLAAVRAAAAQPARITPAMLTLVTLTEAEIDAIVAGVDGGAANVQDIYPLAPLQEGILFHHLLARQGDAYLQSNLLGFRDRARLERFVAALQQVVDRHDILRTGFAWQGLAQPVQVVRRRAALPVEWLDAEPAGDAAVWLQERYHPRRLRIGIDAPPLLRCQALHDAAGGRWLLHILAHHLVSDHATLERVLAEARAIERGEAAQLPAPVPFRNFVAQARLGVSEAEHEAFFRRMLGDVEAPTAPFGRLAAHGDGAGLAEVQRLLPPELAQALRQQARRLGVGAAGLLHLAWARVLARLAGQRTVVFGTVLFGRMHGGAEADRALGLFINTLPLRFDVDGRSVEQAARDMQALLVQLLRHEHAPLALAQRCSALPAQTPLFSALLNYRYSAADPAQALGEGIDYLGGEERSSYPVSLDIDDLGQDFRLTAQVGTADEARRLCDFMETAVASLVDALERDPVQPLYALDTLPATERAQLDRWAGHTAGLPRESCLHELFEAQARRAPEAIALLHGERRLSYAELDARAERLAQRLRQFGVAPDARVALHARRSPELVVALLAILKAGGAYVPLDPDYPAERLAQMLADSGPVALLYQGGLPDELARALDPALPKLDLDQPDFGATDPVPAEADALPRLVTAAERPVAHAGDLAYVIYTSGSTGVPKGVMVEHRSVVNQVTALAQRLGLEPGQRMLQFASLSFDASVEEVFATLACGATLVLRSDAWLADAATFWDLCAAQRIAVVDLPTQFWTQLALARRPIPACVRWIIIGGEAVGEAALRAWFDGPGSRPRLLNTYGPTEATVSATALEVAGADDWRSIGRPSANVVVRILDALGQLVPVGVAGELHIGGVQLARGYLNRPELTAERFIDDPFGAPGERLYKTGDLARWKADGTIDYLGRNDFQVKIRGFRIELGEIEARLAEVDGVREAVVLAREEAPGAAASSDVRLVAYYLGEAIEAEQLRRQLAQRLPAYMVPAAYVRLEAFPLTPNGKLDRKALPAPDGTAYAQREYEAPQGEAETTLAALWAELLKLDRVGRHDHFFELGGHSLLAVQLLSRVRKAFGAEVALAELFARPVLSELAAHLTGAAPALEEAIAPADRSAPLPLSLAQQRLWFLARMDEAGTAYHLGGAVRLDGELDVAALQHALQAIVDRHEALRTCFPLVDGQPEQRVLGRFELAIEQADLRGGDEAGSRRELAGHFARPFALERTPPLRVLLLQVADQSWLLQVVMHHIVSDGWSVGLFLNELSRLYAAALAGESNPLPPLAIQYPDYAAWQRGWLAGGRFERQQAFWRDTLAGAPTLLELPSYRPRPARQDHAGASLDLRLDAALSRGLKALSQRHGTTLYTTLLASWAAVLGRLAGQDEVVIGSPVAGRNRAEIEPLIGFFVNTLALRIDLAGEPTVAELLQRTQAQVLAAQQHQDLPFDQVVEAVQPLRSLSHTPLFQTMLAWQNTPAGELAMPGLTLTELDTAQTTAQFDLTLSLQESGDGIAGTLNYATALFDAGTVQRYLGHWITLLTAMVADPTQAVDRLPLLDAAQRRQLLLDWNDTTVGEATTAAVADRYPAEACLHQLFEAQAARTPDAIAVTFGAQRLGYAELNARANQLAHHLRAQGLGPDRLAAICVERGLEMVVAILAVLKAGGAYVPLDPAYASDRLAATLADSRPVLALVDEVGRAALGADVDLPLIDLRDDDRWADASIENLADIGVKPQHLAYVIYTSGSTGVPKGVMVEHRNVVRLFGATDAWFGFGADDVWTLFHSFGFDFSVWEIWGALLYGGRLVVVPLATARAPAEFYQLLCDEGVTVLNQTPSAFQQLIAAQGEGGSAHRLRTVVFGGEALELRTLRPWYARPLNRATQLVNMYGITETTVHVTYCPLQPADVERPGPSPIGVRIPDLRLYVLDGQRQPVPIGVAGELYVGGAGVARGYLNRPELTAERFVDNPFGAAGDRLYKTGDLARWRTDGTIEYLGRNDFQVKIRGFRIELGEIEARLAALDGVREVVVLAREDVPGDKRLVAYYLGGEAADAETLRRHAVQQLPAYMVPAAYVRLESFPLTPNGKLDRKALPAPDGTAYAQREYEAPEGETETTLAALWAELLKLDRVGRHDNFFELGGHSLLAVSLIERLRQAGLHGDVRSLFAAPTLAELATRLGRDSQAVAVPPNLIEPGADRITPAMLPLVQLSQAEIDAVVAGVDGGAANVQDIYPLAPLQEGILFHHLSAREGDPYLVYSLLGFKDRARLDGFLAALRQVIARHDILRTGIAWQGLPQPVQVVWRQVELPLEHLVLDPADGEIADQLAARNDPRRQRLDVGRAPLLRCQVAEDAAHGRWLLGVLSHHLIDDNTTVRLLAAEARAIEQGRAAQLPPPVPFRNYVAQAASGLGRHEHELFFARLLGDIDAPTAPFGLGDAHRDGRDIAELRRPLASGLAQALRGQARRLGVSAASLFHLAWALVVARASGRRAAVFGTVLLGRMQGGAEADRALGLFINTLPLRLDVDDRPVEQAVRDVQALLAELMRHEHASLALAQRCSALPAQAPLFTALLNYRHGEEAPALDGGIEQLAGSERSNYPLTLSVDDFGRDFALTVQAAAPLAPQRVHDFMAAALAALLDALQQAPGRPLAALDVLPPAERALLLDGWNDTAADYPREACLHRLVEARAARAPDAVALEQGGRRIAYAELDAEAGRLARHLRRLGVGPDVPVAVCLDRSPELVIALLAVLKAGGAYLPLDPAYPAERLDQLLHDAAPRALLTHALLGAALAAQLCIGAARLDAACPVIDLQADAGRWQDEPAGPLPDDGLRPRHLACVIYTSGSTGVPKGVMVEHRGLVNLVAWHGRAFGLGPDSRCSSTAGLGFDASGWEIWPVLCHGGRLLLPPPAAHDPQALLDWWRAQPLDVGFLVTPLAEFACASGRANPRAHTLLIGGDRLRRWPDGLPAGQALVNNYGPTEATVVATSGRLQPGGPVHIGRPIANTRIYLLDAAMRPVPVGVAGELYIGGDGLARGYLNRPALTAERFVDDPFRPGERLYRSGDLARWLPDGTIEYLGRDDFQVKIRGFRIELGEIEAALAAVDGVREAAVLARGAAAGGGMPDDLQLVAYYSGAALAAETLRQALARRLPAHMLPAAYVRLEAFPLTPNGKLDRQALPAPDAAAYAQREYEAPQGETETRLAALWAELLKLDRIGRHDDFFALGGHSLLAVQLLSRLRTAFAVELPLAELFARPVLSELAVRLAAAAPAPMEPIAPADRSAPLPLSLAQQRLWFLSRLDDGGAAYHLSGAVRLRGVLERDALARALQGVVERHEALRTCFPLVDGRPVQQVLAGACLAIEWDDLRGRPEAEAQRRLAGHAAAPFALAEAMPLRVLLLQLDEREHLLQVVMHHIAADGWSVGLFLDELSRLYAAALAGEPDPLPPLAIQYADYAAWQRGWLAGGRFERQQAFWRDTLKDAPTLLELPSDRPRPARQDHTGASLDVRLDAALSRSLKALGRRHGSTLYMTLLASWAAVLGRLAGQDEVVIGSPVAGRNRAEVEPLIGFFVNTLALRIDLGGEPTVAELLQRTREQVLAAQQHQDLPFDQVVEAVQPPRSLAHTPLFQVMLDWHNTPRGRLELPGLAVAEVEAELPTAQFDLMLSLREDGETIAGALNYATALFDAATAARYLRHWTVLLAAMAADDGRTVSRLPLLDAAQRRQLLVDWNDTARALPLERCVHELFEAQAARTPAAIAIDDGERRLSYAELNRQANRLAHHLRALGVLPDARVALCAERGAPMLVGLLAIFKAGGAYVPLDPDYPGERIAYMLRDSTPVAALCSSAARPALQRWLERPLPVLDLEADAAQWQRQPEHDPSPRAVGLNARHLAYVIYTSGSTGRPKGVMIEHRGLVNYTLAAIDWFGLGPGERVLQQNSLNFDLSIEESLPALLSGATLLPSAELFGLVRGQDRPGPAPTMVHLTAAHWHSLVGEWSRPGADTGQLDGVRLVNVTGDALSPHKLQQWDALRPAATGLINTYGPTEITVSCSAAYVRHDPAASRVSIGRPFANTRMYLLDAHGEPVPVGVAGELHIAGEGVARGYLNLPELTDARFLADPFVPGARMYRTGDLARWRPDGEVEFIGRNDFQVKVRGFRIELGEVEARLARADGVEEVVVLAREDAPGDKRLVAYYTGAQAPSAEALRQHALQGLPQYMVPAAWVRLAALPLTPNGKLDRQALPAPDGAALAKPAYAAPEGETEAALARIWAELLGVERVGRHDNFFELGGHSLLAVSLVERMRREDLQADVTLLFTAPTLAELAAGTRKLKEILL